MFSKEHYKVLASIIKDATKSENSVSKSALLILLCSHFKLDNSRFDEEKFRLACDGDT